MSEPKLVLAALFLFSMLGLWFALMVKGRREDFETHSPTPESATPPRLSDRRRISPRRP